MHRKHTEPLKNRARRRQPMYQKREKQVSLYENPICFATGAPLDPQNRWVKLSGMIPWDLIEEKYSLTFDNPIICMQNGTDNDLSAWTNMLRPAGKSLSIPLQILLMLLRYVFRHGTVLT